MEQDELDELFDVIIDPTKNPVDILEITNCPSALADSGCLSDNIV